MSQSITFDLSKADATAFFNALGAALTDSSGPSSSKGAKSGKVKRQNSNKGKPTCHGDFVKMICEKLKEEMATFKKENPDQKGAHLVFAANYKKEHAEEFAAFEAAWKEAHPKDADAGSVSSKQTGAADGNSKSEASPVKDKPKRVISDEQKAKMKAGREAAAAKKKAEASGAPEAPEAPEAPVTTQKKPVKTAKKASPAEITVPVVAPIVESSPIASELIPFTFNGSTFLRMGVKLPNGDARFTSAHLWMSKKGAKGPHYGEIREDGTIDMEAEEPVA